MVKRVLLSLIFVLALSTMAFADSGVYDNTTWGSPGAVYSDNNHGTINTGVMGPTVGGNVTGGSATATATNTNTNTATGGAGGAGGNVTVGGGMFSKTLSPEASVSNSGNSLNSNK